MRTLSLTVCAAQDGRSVKSLMEQEWKCSSRLTAKLRRRDTGILLNGSKVYTTARVQTGDVLTIEIGDEQPVQRVEPIPVPMDVVWEDADILVLNKPAGMVVHPCLDIGAVSVEHALSYYLPPEDGIHPVSRLDRGTTGLMTIAKNGYMHDRLRNLLHTPDFYREYIGIAEGIVTPAAGHITLPIGYAEGSNYQRAVREDGMPAHTEYETLTTVNGLSVLRLIPHTGRNHQLRLHLSAIGYPLVGDWLYGTEDKSRIGRPALHSCRLVLRHPLTGERLALECPMPKDMQRLIEK
ncbi:MAG: RluA family pseudouridine synthase [Eubacteriales bacterium]|nr:RluA family pseudouridine synthase [Eubacteriales bacterium]